MTGDAVLGTVMRSARKDCEMSQSEVESLSGIPKARLSRYENGHVMPSVPSLRRIAKAVGVPASEMLRRAGW
jgi:transcriptional regulator with XRE-family HTH domain